MIRKVDTIRGCYYFSQPCRFCKKLITGESEQSRKRARLNFRRRMTQHGQLYHPELREGGGTEMAKAGRHK